MLTALALLPAVLFIRFTTPLYTGSATLLVGPSTGDSADARLMQSSVAPETMNAQRKVILSTPVLAAALAAPAVKDCDPVRDHRDMIEFLRRALSVQSTDGSLLLISISSTDPDDATCIVAAIVQSYTQFLSSLRRNGNSDAVAILQAKKAERQAELASKSADLLRFAKEHRVGSTDVSAAGVAELSRLAESLAEAHAASIDAKAANDDLNRELASDPERTQSLKWFEESSTPPSGVDAQDDVQDRELIRGELLILKQKQAELLQKFMPGHPSLVKIEQRIEELNNRRDAAIQRQATLAAQREADLQRAYDDEQARMLDQTTHQTQYAQRAAELAELQKSIDDVDQRMQNLNLSDNSGLPTVTILDAAAASPEPTSPNRRRILLLAATAGLALSGLLACWLERGRLQVIRHDLAGFDLPILAELPILSTDFGPLADELEMPLNAEPALDEIFRGLNAVLQGAVMRGRGVITLVTSPSRADGKSTLASNLAVSLAQTHKRVLLVDADLRSPVQARVFGIGNATGLATLLEAEVSIPITAIHHTGMPSLDVIPSGPATRNPAELVNSQRFIDLIGDLAERYDYVVVDSPPTVTFSEARTISASCDLTIMVMRTDLINRRMYQLATDGLINIGANLCGMVLNSGYDSERSDQLLRRAPRRSEKPTFEKTVARKLSALMLSAAKAVDLVRLPPTNRRVSSSLRLPGTTDSKFRELKRTRKKLTSAAPLLQSAANG